MAVPSPLTKDRSDSIFNEVMEKINHDTITLRANKKDIISVGGPKWQSVWQAVTGEIILVCDYCGDIDFVEKTIPAYSGANTICSQCTKHYSWCDGCQSYILTTDINNPYHQDASIPISKFPQFFTQDQDVEAWNVDVMAMGGTKFLKTNDEHLIWKHNTEAKKKIYTRFFGIELEVEKATFAPPDMVKRVYSWSHNYCAAKHDGSLSNKGKGGFEIVTVPATLKYHESGIWDNFFEYIAPYLEFQPPTTGLHIHMGTDTLRRLTSAKMLMFINSKTNRDFVQSLANRELTEPNPNGKLYAAVKDDWSFSKFFSLAQHQPGCPWHPNNRKSSLQYAIEAGHVKTDPHGNPIIASLKPSAVTRRPVCKCAPGMYNIEKYQAFNPMTKRPTIELRMFKGIVSKEFLYACLEFTDALADFCETVGPNNLGYEDFLSWFCLYNKDQSGRSKTYPSLTRLLINKSWINPKKVK